MHRSLQLTALGMLTLLIACGKSPQTPSANPTIKAQSVRGAAFTTTNPPQDNPDPINSPVPLCLNGQDSENGTVNCNIYTSKEYVWMNGGPLLPGKGPALTDGTYFFAVLEPGGQPDPNDGGDKNLSYNINNPYTNRTFTVMNGTVASYNATGDYDPHDYDSTNNKIRLFPYTDTRNNGGVYILALCQYDPLTYNPASNRVKANNCKYDAFKVRPSGTPPTDVSWMIEGYKYYDGNRDGNFDSTEVGIENWKIALTVNERHVHPDLITNIGGYWVYASEPAEPATGGKATVQVWERMPVSTPSTSWEQTGNVSYNATGNTSNATVNPTTSATGVITTYTITVPLDQNASVSNLNFGNVCKVTPGGRTMGFWSNKHGELLFNVGDDLAQLVALNLRRADGKNFDPRNYGGYRTWLLDASATNMAYMLSAQLSATKLNTINMIDGKLITDPTVYVTPTYTVSELVNHADNLLRMNGYTPAGHAARASQETAMKLLDAVNNQQSFYQPRQDTCSAITNDTPWQ